MTKHKIEAAVRRKSAVRGKQVVVRLQPHELQAVDAWVSMQDKSVTRPEAIRRMIDIVRRANAKRDTKV